MSLTCGLTRRGGRPPEESLLKEPLHSRGGARQDSGRLRGAGAKRRNLARAVSRAPEAMVKIISYQKSARSVRQTANYICRKGELELNTSEGETLRGAEAVREFADDLSVGEKADQRHSLHMQVSMPAGTDREAVRRAAERFAAETFGANHTYGVAHHEDTDHPHAHILIKMKGHDGKRLRPGLEDLQAWREAWAASLEREGVRAAATPRDSRGQWLRAERQAFRHMRARGDIPRVYRSQAEEIAEDTHNGGAQSTPWMERMRARHAEVRTAWHEMADAADKDDPDLATAIRAFAGGIEEPSTRADRARARYAERMMQRTEQRARLRGEEDLER